MIVQEKVAGTTVLEGKVTQDFMYTRVMYSDKAGFFIVVPQSGEYRDKTIAIDVNDSTIVNVGGKSSAAKDLKLQEVIRKELTASVKLEKAPQKIETSGWQACAEYFASATKITL